VSPDGALIAVSEGGNHRVQLFDGRRQFIRFIGRAGTGIGQFVTPGATVDAQHRIWVGDGVRRDVQLFSEDGTYVSAFDGDGHLAEPGGIFVREDTGELYITDFDGRRISVFDEHGAWLRDYGSLPEQGLRFSNINKVHVDEAGRMFVVDTTNQIFVLDPDGHLIGKIPSRLPEGIGDVDLPGFALGNDGRLYLADVAEQRIVIVQLLPPLWPPPG
jgi:tripartite motif-containing protein 71